MNDLISRQEAIDAIRASTKKYTGFMEMEMYTDDDAVEAIINLPSAQLDRKKGKWVSDRTFDSFWVCSVCGFPSEAHGANIIYKFCPNCGARMKGEADGN